MADSFFSLSLSILSLKTLRAYPRCFPHSMAWLFHHHHHIRDDILCNSNDETFQLDSLACVNIAYTETLYSLARSRSYLLSYSWLNFQRRYFNKMQEISFKSDIVIILKCCKNICQVLLYIIWDHELVVLQNVSNEATKKKWTHEHIQCSFFS